MKAISLKNPIPAYDLRGSRRVLATSAILVAAAAVAVLAMTVVLSPPAGLGALALVIGLVAPLIAAGSLLRRRPPAVTAADHVTLMRVMLTGVLAAATVFAAGEVIPARGWMLTATIAVALATDALDGWIARRTGTAGPVGARFDMEADAALLVALSVLATMTVGAWVLAIGAMRYVFVVASWVRPRLRAPLRYSRGRRIVAAVQGIALLTAVVPPIPEAVSAGVIAVALALLTFSFGRDVLTLEARGS